MRYKDIYFPEDESYHPKAVSRNLHMDHVDRELAERILAQLETLDAPMKVLQLRVLGGASSTVAGDATAYGHRQSKIMGNVASFYETEEEMKQRERWADEFLELLDQGDRAVYSNFVSLHDPSSRFRDAYPEKTWERLIEVKRIYDPTNFFHHNLNIPVN